MNVIRKKWYHKILRPFLNFSGTIQGYSGCGVCGDTWNWKKEHTIKLSERNLKYIDLLEYVTSAQIWERKMRNLIQFDKDHNEDLPEPTNAETREEPQKIKSLSDKCTKCNSWFQLYQNKIVCRGCGAPAEAEKDSELEKQLIEKQWSEAAMAGDADSERGE